MPRRTCRVKRNACRPGYHGHYVNGHLGRPAFPFRLTDERGRLHALESCRGHWLLLVFHRHLR